MMGRMLEVYLIGVWVLVPSFFWIRGFWRNNRADRLAALILNGVLVVAVSIAGDSCAGINAAGVP